MTDSKTYTTPVEAADVTGEMIEAMREIKSGWPDDPWEDQLDRLDGMELADGTTLDLGEDLLSPACRRLRRVRASD